MAKPHLQKSIPFLLCAEHCVTPHRVRRSETLKAMPHCWKLFQPAGLSLLIVFVRINLTQRHHSHQLSVYLKQKKKKLSGARLCTNCKIKFILPAEAHVSMVSVVTRNTGKQIFADPFPHPSNCGLFIPTRWPSTWINFVRKAGLFSLLRTGKYELRLTACLW